MNRILAALAAVMLAAVLLASPAEARCWRLGHHLRCAPVRHHVVYRPLYPYADYQYYRPYLYQPYPYYASYPAPERPFVNYHGCLPIGYFCW